MRKCIAVLLLLVFATFLAAAGADACEEESHGHTHRTPHILCVDDCAPALVPLPPVAPPPDPMPKAVYEETVSRPVLAPDIEPEKAPPRL